METSAVTELRVAVAVSLPVRTLPMFRTAQTLHNTNKASEQTTDLHRSLGTPRGGPLCNVAGAHRVAAADEEIPMQLLKLCYPNIPPPSYLILLNQQTSCSSEGDLSRRIVAYAYGDQEGSAAYT